MTLSIPILQAALQSALAGTAAKGTLDLNKKDEKPKVLGDSVELKDQLMEEPKPKKRKYIDKDALAVTLAMGGLSSPEVDQVMKTGVLTEKMAKKLNKDVFQDIEDLTGVSVFPTGEKPKGTPPITGTTIKKQTRTETPDGEVKETTTTFDSNSGVKKSTGTVIPEDDELKELLSNIDLVNSKDFEQNPVVQRYLDSKGLQGEDRAKAIKDLVRNANENISKRKQGWEAKTNSEKTTKAASRTYGHSVDVDEAEILDNGLTRGQQNLKRHQAQEARAQKEEQMARKRIEEEYKKSLRPQNAPKFDD